ncbi:hypothetical protein AgCh_027084 [Apium graveolens]
MGIRKVLHLVRSEDGKFLEIRAAIFDMTKEEKGFFCSVLEKAKFPYGCATNISLYVYTKERTISGYKSHDAHFNLHFLLQFAVKKTLKPQVTSPLIRLGAFLRGLWCKVIDLADLNRLREEIVEIVCEFEMIFPSSFFVVMVHLLVHLCDEVEMGGPAHLRCMRSIEHNLARLKSYVRNKPKPEGSITEGYLADECLTFCSRFLSGDSVPKFNRCPKKMEYPIGTKRNKEGKPITLKESHWMACHRMEEQRYNLIFFYLGKFQNSEYVGGRDGLIAGVEPDRFSYTVLMEHDFVEEVEENFNRKLSDEVSKVKKVQDNVSLVLHKLLETHLGLNIDMAQICGTISGDTGADGTTLTSGRRT